MYGSRPHKLVEGKRTLWSCSAHQTHTQLNQQFGARVALNNNEIVVNMHKSEEDANPIMCSPDASGKVGIITLCVYRSAAAHEESYSSPRSFDSACVMFV